MTQGETADEIPTVPTVRLPEIWAEQDVADDQLAVWLRIMARFPLREMARIIHRDAHASWCWTVLRLNTSSPAAVAKAASDLRAILAPLLIVELTKAEATIVWEQLGAALVEPPRCVHQDCRNYATTQEMDAEVCDVHVTPDALDAYERAREH